MTQKHVQISAHAVLLILGVSTAWAEVEMRQPRRELLSAPKCCCEKTECSVPQCCTATATGATCAKEKATTIECRLGMVCSIDFKDTPLEEAIEHFRKWSGVNIVVDEPALAETGVSLQRPMSLKVDGIPLKRALQMLLRQVHLSYLVENDVVLLTSEAHSRGELINKVYPVEGLVPPSELVVIAVNNRESVFGWATDTPAGRQLLDEAPEDTLVGLLTNTIKPESWNGNGGLGTVGYFPPCKSLVVYQTRDVQEQVGDLLSALNRLNGTLEKDASVNAPDPLLGLPLSGPTACPLLGMATPLPQDYAQPLAPTLPIAASPFPAPCPVAGCMQPCAQSPAPSASATPARKSYVLAMEMRQRHGGFINCETMCLVVPTKHSARAEAAGAGMLTKEETDQGCRKGLLQVKAAVLKNDRIRVELLLVQGKAEKTGSGNVNLDLHATPVVDRILKPGKKVKVVVDRDEDGKPCKWVEMIAREMGQPSVPAAAVWPNPVPMPSMTPPMPCLATPMPCQPAYPIMPPPPAIMECVAAQPQNPLEPTWQVRAVVVDGETRLALQGGGGQDSVTLKALEIKVFGSDPLKLRAAGNRIQASSPCLQAQADSISRLGGGRLVFEGNVKLHYNKQDPHTEVTAECVRINLADGHMEIESAAKLQPHSFSFFEGYFR